MADDQEGSSSTSNPQENATEETESVGQQNLRTAEFVPLIGLGLCIVAGLIGTFVFGGLAPALLPLFLLGVGCTIVSGVAHVFRDILSDAQSPETKSSEQSQSAEVQINQGKTQEVAAQPDTAPAVAPQPDTAAVAHASQSISALKAAQESSSKSSLKASHGTLPATQAKNSRAP